MTTKILYVDTVTLTEDAIQIATREGSIEVNMNTNTVYGYRVNIDGCWSIVSLNRYDKEMLEKLKHRVFKVSLGSCGGLAEAELYRGYVEIGKEFPDVDEMTKLIYDLCSESKGYGIVKCEAIITLRNVSRTITRDVNDEAHELKRLVEVEIGLISRSTHGLISFASSYGAVIPWNSRDVIRYVEESFKATMNKILDMHNLKPLKPYLYGRTTVILDYFATAALFHELSHMLDATYSYGLRIIGYRICPNEVEVYDEPHNMEAPSLRFFDDEGVISKRRMLIENGVVRDLHNTRNTAKIVGSEPGSAHGLFHRPIPFHTTLVVKPGDWKQNEMLEDTKRGFYIGGVVMATLEEGFIRIVPEYSYIIENGELKEVVKIKEVRVPISGIKTITALSKDTKIRTSYEKSWLVSEIVPMVRLDAYIQ